METEISDIFSQQNSVSKKDIVCQRLIDLPFNSVIWAVADLYEKIGTVEKVNRLWTHAEIFSMGRQK